MTASDHLSGDQFDYRGGHQPTLSGPPIHNLLEPDKDQGTPIAPPDIYTHMHYYSGGESYDHESMAAIHSARGDRPLTPRPARDNSRLRELGVDLPDTAAESPERFAARQTRRQSGNAPVTVYRAAPRGLKQLNAGDWVTPSRSYALGHAKHATDKAQDMTVYKAKVPAKHVRWATDSINEFGYSGPGAATKVHRSGGKNGPRV